MRQFDEEALNEEIERTRLNVSVFLAGPSIAVDGPAPEDNPAARARYHLFHRLKRQENIICTIGEHKQLIALYEKEYGDLANLAVAEISHTIKHSDCTVILPSSPGSFCELGMFSMSDQVCRRMLILVDANHVNPPGYVLLGPVPFAKSYGAKVHIVDYEDDEEIWAKVTSFLEHTENKKKIARLRVPG